VPYFNFKMRDGSLVGGFICGGPKLKACGFCGCIAGRQCDYRAAANLPTCDAWICDDCSTSGGKNIDYCPAHKDKAATQATMFG